MRRGPGVRGLAALLLAFVSTSLLVLPQMSALGKTSASGGISGEVSANCSKSGAVHRYRKGDSHPYGIEAVRTTVEGARRLGRGAAGAPSTEQHSPRLRRARCGAIFKG